MFPALAQPRPAPRRPTKLHPILVLDRSQSLFYFVPQEKNITVKLAILVLPRLPHRFLVFPRPVK